MDADKEGMIASTGYNMPFLNDRLKPMPVLGADQLRCFRIPEDRGVLRHPGPYSPQIQEVANLFVLPDISRRWRGRSVDAAVNWGTASTPIFAALRAGLRLLSGGPTRQRGRHALLRAQPG